MVPDLDDSPLNRFSHSAFMGKSKMVVFGGRDIAGHYFSLEALSILHVQENGDLHWESRQVSGVAPCARSGQAISQAKCGDVFLFGGYSAETKCCLNDVWKLFVSGQDYFWQKLECNGSPPSPRRAHSIGIVYGRFLVVSGGTLSSSHEDVSDLKMWD